MNGLEPDRNPVYHDEERASETKCKPAGRCDRTLSDNSERNGSVFAFVVLDDEEYDGQDAEETEAEDDSPIGPRILGATPLKSKKAANDIEDEHGRTPEVELVCPLTPGNAGLGLPGRRMEEEDDDHEGDKADWKIDIKAPTPRNMVGECTSKKRTCNAGNTIHGS